MPYVCTARALLLALALIECEIAMLRPCMSFARATYPYAGVSLYSDIPIWGYPYTWVPLYRGNPLEGYLYIGVSLYRGIYIYI